MHEILFPEHPEKYFTLLSQLVYGLSMKIGMITKAPREFGMSRISINDIPLWSSAIADSFVRYYSFLPTYESPFDWCKRFLKEAQELGRELNVKK